MLVLLLAATTFGPLPSRMLRGAVALRQTEHRLASSIFAGSDSRAVPDVLPELIVFDLDACLWDKEMFEMSAVPDGPKDSVRGDLNGRGDGVTGVLSGCDKISLHTGALAALQAHADGDFAGVRVALASSANTRFAESVGRAALTVLEVLPGLTVWQLLMRDWKDADVNQIGRQPPLSANKAATHFPRLREATGVPFDRMLFFDDCNWVRGRGPRPREAATAHRPRADAPGGLGLARLTCRRFCCCVCRAITVPWCRAAARRRAGLVSCACARPSG